MTHKDMTDRITNAMGTLPPPVAVYYTDEKPEGVFEWNCKGDHFCHIGRLGAVRAGKPLAVDSRNPGCMGAAQFLGWAKNTSPGFEYFLSHDDEGHGERFKKTPEMARSFIESFEFVPATGSYCVFQRLEDVPDDIEPEVVALFAETDQLAALYWLANYGRPGKDAVVAPMTSGCGSIVSEPRAQALKSEPQGVLGMFDVAARPKDDKRYLALSVPYKMFIEMVENIPGSFLEIEPWMTLRNR